MSEKTIKGKTADEAKRIAALLHDNGIPDEQIALLDPIITNVAWQRIKLDEARKAIANSTIAIPYDNGGGQAGIRENPAFKGYESLFKSYMGGMKAILERLPDAKAEIAAPVEKPKSVLEMVRLKHGKEA